MNNTVLTTSAVMMETMWEEKRKDLLDLITPFVLYSIAQKTSIGGEIKIDYILQNMKDFYGYSDIPDSVIRKILNRNSKKCIKRERNKYFLIKDLGEFSDNFDKRCKECDDRINKIGNKLAIYLRNHCTRWKQNYTSEECILHLQDFFSRYGLFVGIDRLEQQIELSPKEHEIDYYIARYIYDNKKDNTIEYKDILDLVKGYFLKTVVYLQPENGNLLSANYRNVDFYYDTPILLNLLGYQSEDEEKAAHLLHEKLGKQKANFYYFNHAETEMKNILSAYQHSLRSGEYTGRTLEGLDRKKYTASSVERLKDNWKRQLKNTFQINEKNIPEYIVKENGTVDESKVLDEKELISCIRKRAKSYKQENIERDVDSVLAIHRLRKSYVCENIESARAIFITNNFDLANSVNSYYKRSVNKKAFPLVLTSAELSAILWVKNGTNADLPEKQLLNNAYAALQPMPELLNKLSEVLEQMKLEGRVTSEEVTALRTSHYVHRELWKETFGDENLTNENTIMKIKQKYDNSIIENYKHEKELEKKEEKQKLYEKAQFNALEAGKKAKQKWLRGLRNGSKLIAVLIFVGCICATIKTWGKFNWNIFFVIVIVITALSLYDICKARKKFIDGILVKIANHQETRIIEKKKSEYLKLFDREK